MWCVYSKRMLGRLFAINRNRDCTIKFSEARPKLDICIFKELNQALTHDSDKGLYRWYGHRVLSLVDSKPICPANCLLLRNM